MSIDLNQQNPTVVQQPVTGSPTQVNPQQQPNPLQESLVTGNIKYAGFWIRLTAFIIDVFVIMFLLLIIIGLLAKLGALGQEARTGPVQVVVGGPSGTSVNGKTGGMPSSVVDIALLLTILAYGTGTIASTGTTIGKKLHGIKVINKEGKKPKLFKAFLRSSTKFLLAPFLFGFLVAAFSEKKQALHDMIAGTYAVTYSSRSKAVALAILTTILILVGIIILKFAFFLAFILNIMSQIKPS